MIIIQCGKQNNKVQGIMKEEGEGQGRLPEGGDMYAESKM